MAQSLPSHAGRDFFPITQLPQEVVDAIQVLLSATDPVTLLQWSSTSRFYRDLLGPHVFRSLTLGLHVSPLQCVDALSEHKHIKSLTFSCATTRPSPLRRSRPCKVLENHERHCPLTYINCSFIDSTLRHLPPALSSLILHFPDHWITHNQAYWPRFSFETEDQPLADGDRVVLNRTLLWTVLDAVAKNDISQRPDGFELQILNISPFVSGVYHQPCFRTFLGHVTSFTLSLCIFEPDPLNRMHPKNEWFRYLLSGWFYDNLERVRNFKLISNAAWQVAGEFPWSSRISYSTLSPKPEHMPQLRHLTLENTFIDTELIDFLTTTGHPQALETITLHNCFCHATTSEVESEAEAEMETVDIFESPTWSNLFDSMVDAHPSNLVSVKITYDEVHLKARMPCYYDKNHDPSVCKLRRNDKSRPICESLMHAAAIDAECPEYAKYIALRTPCECHAHRTMMFLYSTIDPGKGSFASGRWDTCMRYGDGRDMESWKRLAKVMNANGGRHVLTC
ncbi:hypothetical protein LTR46_001196 [Exophiala xenobiotica]|nr:hypothetical protein LTR46_001196 [Exophiala xenobiotica]